MHWDSWQVRIAMVRRHKSSSQICSFHPSYVSWQTTCKYNIGPFLCVSGNISGSAGLILLFPKAKKKQIEVASTVEVSTIAFFLCQLHLL